MGCYVDVREQFARGGERREERRILIWVFPSFELLTIGGDKSIFIILLNGKQETKSQSRSRNQQNLMRGQAETRGCSD